MAWGAVPTALAPVPVLCVCGTDVTSFPLHHLHWLLLPLEEARMLSDPTLFPLHPSLLLSPLPFSQPRLLRDFSFLWPLLPIPLIFVASLPISTFSVGPVLYSPAHRLCSRGSLLDICPPRAMPLGKNVGSGDLPRCSTAHLKISCVADEFCVVSRRELGALRSREGAATCLLGRFGQITFHSHISDSSSCNALFTWTPLLPECLAPCLTLHVLNRWSWDGWGSVSLNVMTTCGLLSLSLSLNCWRESSVW